jgi:hypothetical protein
MADQGVMQRAQQPVRRRALLLTCLGATVAAGLLSRAYPVGWRVWDERAGDTLYAVAVYLAVQLVVRTGAVWGWVAAAGISGLVEAIKLTGLPAAWSGVRIARLLLGTTPSVANVAWYVVGAGAAAGIHAVVLRGCRGKA